MTKVIALSSELTLRHSFVLRHSCFVIFHDSCWQSCARRVRCAVMRPVRRFVALAFLLACCAVIGAEPARLPAAQIAKAAHSDPHTIPTPGERLSESEKPGKSKSV